MPIAPSDLQIRYSVPTATQGNQIAGNAGSSHGGWLSTTPIIDSTLDNLFPDVTGDENASLHVDYKCLFVVNNHATLTLQRATAWLYSEVAGGANCAFAGDGKGWTINGSPAIQAAVIPNKDTAPIGVTAFSLATTKATGIVLADVPPLSCIAVWLRRTSTNSVAQTNDGCVLRVEGDTSQ